MSAWNLLKSFESFCDRCCSGGFKTFKLRATLPAASVRTCWAANHMKFRPTMALSSTRGRTKYEHNLVKHLYKLMQPYNSPATIIVLVRLIKFN